jgi:hypothetical protein
MSQSDRDSTHAAWETVIANAEHALELARQQRERLGLSKEAAHALIAQTLTVQEIEEVKAQVEAELQSAEHHAQAYEASLEQPAPSGHVIHQLV